MKFVSLIAFTASTLFCVSTASAAKLKGVVKIDGSSTVFPISEAVAEEFQGTQPRVRVTVGVSGTGGGFKKFVKGEIDISDASRPIKSKEIALAKKNKIDFVELYVAYDGLSVMVNPSNTWVKELSIEQLKKIWKPGSNVKTWADVNPKWPKRKINLYGPGPDSGTFDFFTERVMGKNQASRSDYMSSEDDNVLVRGISGDKDALGYFGYAYYAENSKKLKAIPIIDKAKKPVAPNAKSIEDQSYPLARPIFIYVSTKSANRPEVNAFVNFYLENAAALVKEIGYVPLSAKLYKEQQTVFKTRKTGPRFKPTHQKNKKAAH